MHLGDSEQGRERGRTPRRRGGDNLISGKKKFVHVEVGTLFTFLFWKEGVVGEGKEGVCSVRECIDAKGRRGVSCSG